MRAAACHTAEPPATRMLDAAAAAARNVNIRRAWSRIGRRAAQRKCAMELCAQQRVNPTVTKTRRPPAASAGAARAAGPRTRFPATVGSLGRSRPGNRALQLDIPTNPLPVICTKNIIRNTKLPRPGKFFELEMTVRDCELDKYGVVNNAIYAGYIETARQEMIASLGVCTGSIASTGRAMALSELNIKYFAPLKRGAEFVVMVRITQIKGVRMLMEHLIAKLPERQLVLQAMATVVCLNEDYRPTRMFPEMANLLHFFSRPD